MKRNLFYLLPLLLLVAACVPKPEVIPLTPPLGTFTGQFAALVKKVPGSGYDTIRDSITLTMTAPTNFAVLADTTAIHAGSKGSFTYDANSIKFTDLTKMTTGIGSKFHLYGTYQYGYDGTYLVMGRNTTHDTLTVEYALKRLSN